MNAKNYLAYVKNKENTNKQKTMFDNLVVGEVMTVEKINPFSTNYIKKDSKFIFEEVKTDEGVKYIEIFSRMVFTQLNGGKGPFISNIEPLLNYIDLDNIDINNIVLEEISDQINNEDKEKELTK